MRSSLPLVALAVLGMVIACNPLPYNSVSPRGDSAEPAPSTPPDFAVEVLEE